MVVESDVRQLKDGRRLGGDEESQVEGYCAYHRMMFESERMCRTGTVHQMGLL